MQRIRAAVLAVLCALALAVGQAGTANGAKGGQVIGDGQVVLTDGTYAFNFAASTNGKGGFTIVNVANPKNRVTAGKTSCFSRIDAYTTAIVGTASNKHTDPTLNEAPYLLIIAFDSPISDSLDAIYIDDTRQGCPASIPADVTLTTISRGDITYTP